MAKLSINNPSTGEPLKTLEICKAESLPAIFEKAKEAQTHWATLSLRQRSKSLLNLREVILNHLDEIVDLIVKENGKPRVEAIINDVLPVIEVLTYFAKKGPKLLKDQKIRLHNPAVFHRKSFLNYHPLGTILVISPWNFPFFLPFSEIAMGLLAGNAIIFKPSEVTPLIGLKIQELIEEAGFPPHIIQTLVGDGSIGAAAIAQKPQKVFFTGSVETGKKIASACAKDLIPYVLELGGKDPMIVLADADLDYASSAALWGGFCNSGQMCASTERLIVHESIAPQFIEQLQKKISQLEQSSKDERKDLGVVTMAKQKQVYESQLAEAKEKKAQFISGGKWSRDKRALQPTLIGGQSIEKLKVYQEESFGPIVAITTFKSITDAIEKANASRYGLCASVITGNLALGTEVARQLEAGTVTINEVAFTAGLPETPWGGVKFSGIGRKHSDHGLLEFVEVRHINYPRFSFLAFFKSFWWFPYTDLQFETFKRLLATYRKSKLRRAKALADFLFTFVRFIKSDRRY